MIIPFSMERSQPRPCCVVSIFDNNVPEVPSVVVLGVDRGMNQPPDENAWFHS